MPDADFTRYSRQVIHPAIGEAGQRALGAAHLLLIGCGALGTHLADTFVRAGVGHLRLVDRDYVEIQNLQRQVLFEEADAGAGLPKAVIAAERLRRINTTTKIEAVVDDANAGNIAALLEGINLIIDGTDNFETRYLLNDAAIAANLPWIYSAVLGTYGMTMSIVPGESACLRCLFPDPPPPGITPTCETAGVLGPAVAMIAAFAAAEAFKLIVGATGAINRDLLACDVWRGTLERLPASRDAACPACGDGARQHPFLERAAASRTAILCGRNAVQITLSASVTLPLAALADRLRHSGTVKQSEHLLRFHPDGAPQELVIFPNGRAIIHGTDEPGVARSLYARYVGL